MKADHDSEPASDDNIDAAESRRFDDLAHQWWDTDGGFRSLHDLNPIRTDYIDRHAPLSDTAVADIGCGGGLLSEAMTVHNARVVGVDVSMRAITIARSHAEQCGHRIDYRQGSAESLCQTDSGRFDRVACLELLEHVPDPAALISACARLLRPEGSAFFSTINRTPTAWALAIIGAEYVYPILPRGTHRYDRFIRPSELAGWIRNAALELRDISGIGYNPLTRQARLTTNPSVNYIVWCQRR